MSLTPEQIVRAAVGIIVKQALLTPHQVSVLVKAPRLSIRRSDASDDGTKQDSSASSTASVLRFFVEWYCPISVSVSKELEAFGKFPRCPFQSYGILVKIDTSKKADEVSCGMRSAQGCLFDTSSVDQGISWAEYKKFSDPIISLILEALPSSNYLGFSPERCSKEDTLHVTVGGKENMTEESLKQAGVAGGEKASLESLFDVAIGSSSSRGYGTYCSKTKEWYGLSHRHLRGRSGEETALVYDGENNFTYSH